MAPVVIVVWFTSRRSKAGLFSVLFTPIDVDEVGGFVLWRSENVAELFVDVHHSWFVVEVFLWGNASPLTQHANGGHNLIPVFNSEQLSERRESLQHGRQVPGNSVPTRTPVTSNRQYLIDPIH